MRERSLLLWARQASQWVPLEGGRGERGAQTSPVPLQAAVREQLPGCRQRRGAQLLTQQRLLPVTDPAEGALGSRNCLLRWLILISRKCNTRLLLIATPASAFTALLIHKPQVL